MYMFFKKSKVEYIHSCPIEIANSLKIIFPVPVLKSVVSLSLKTIWCKVSCVVQQVVEMVSLSCMAVVSFLLLAAVGVFGQLVF